MKEDKGKLEQRVNELTIANEELFQELEEEKQTSGVAIQYVEKAQAEISSMADAAAGQMNERDAEIKKDKVFVYYFKKRLKICKNFTAK